MRIEEIFDQRYRTLREDVKQAIIEAVQPFGEEYHFVTTDDERWKEGAEPDVLGLPHVDGYTYYGGRYESFYVTSVRIDKYGLKFYGIPENYSLDENDCVDLDDTVAIYDIPLPNMIGILECLPKSNEQ